MHYQEPFETVDWKGYQIAIWNDETPDNPRNWDNLCTLVIFHRRYTLGDNVHGWRDSANRSEYRFYDVDEVVEFVSQANVISLPVYAYEHGNISLSIGTVTRGGDLVPGRYGSYSCPWDSGNAGVIFVTKAKLLDEFGWQRITRQRIRKVWKYMSNEILTYNCYLTGTVYGYKILDHDGDEIDVDDEPLSCWGYFGYDHEASGLLTDARNSIDYLIRKAQDKRDEQTLLKFARLAAFVGTMGDIARIGKVPA